MLLHNLTENMSTHIFGIADSNLLIFLNVNNLIKFFNMFLQH